MKGALQLKFSERRTPVSGAKRQQNSAAKENKDMDFEKSPVLLFLMMEIILVLAMPNEKPCIALPKIINPYHSKIVIIKLPTMKSNNEIRLILLWLKIFEK